MSDTAAVLQRFMLVGGGGVDVGALAREIVRLDEELAAAQSEAARAWRLAERLERQLKRAKRKAQGDGGSRA